MKLAYNNHDSLALTIKTILKTYKIDYEDKGIDSDNDISIRLTDNEHVRGFIPCMLHVGDMCDLVPAETKYQHVWVLQRISELSSYMVRIDVDESGVIVLGKDILRDQRDGRIRQLRTDLVKPFLDNCVQISKSSMHVFNIPTVSSAAINVFLEVYGDTLDINEYKEIFWLD